MRAYDPGITSVPAIVPCQLCIYAMTFTCVRPAHAWHARTHARDEALYLGLIIASNTQREFTPGAFRSVEKA